MTEEEVRGKIDRNERDITALWEAVKELKETVDFAFHGDNKTMGVITMSKLSYDYIQKKINSKDDIIHKGLLCIITILIGYVAWKLGLKA